MTLLSTDGLGQGPTKQRRSVLNFWSRLHGKEITVWVNGATAVSGELAAYSTYEIVVKTRAGREVMIPKGAIVTVDLPEGWRWTAGCQEDKTDGQ